MNKTKIILLLSFALILFFSSVLAGVPEKPAPVKGEKENNAASGFKPEEKSGGLIRPRRTATEKTSGINLDATKSEKGIILPVLSGATPDRGVRSEDLTLPKGSVQEKNLTPANFKLVTDVIDGFGGQKSNSGCDRYIFAGGQSSAIGPSNSTNFKLYAGFVHSTVVKCGDANADGSLTVSDVVYLVNYLFKGGPVAKPYEVGEANCDGKVTVSDVVYLVNYLFKGGPVPIC